MSLIDEALKRAQAADRLSAPPSSTAVPIHLPQRRPRWRLAGFGIGAALAIAAAGVWFGVHHRGETVLTRWAPARAISVPVIPATARPLAPTGIPSAAPTRVLAAASTPAAKPLAQLPPSEALPTAPRTAARAAAAESGAPHSLVNGKAYSGEILLAGGAKITLDGIVYSDDNPVALINGLVLGPGASIEGMTIDRIEADRVVLQGHGATVSLLVK